MKDENVIDIEKTSGKENSIPKIELTREGYENIVKERSELLDLIEINKVELQEARAQGDLSENAEYDVARDNQAKLNHRLQQIDEIIKNHIIIEKVINTGLVVLTSKVTFEDLSEEKSSVNRIKTYVIVGSVEADPVEGKISNISPLGTALFGSKAGDIVEVTGISHPYSVKILKVE